MDSPDPKSTDSVSGCSRCGSSAGSVYWQGGVCLRCAGERLFGGEPPVPAGAIQDDRLPGTLGPYTLIEEIGRGGMGRVYAAQQTGLGRIVALKVMGDAGKSADFELRFLREAQTAARLRHPNLLTVHDFGRADGRIYFSMDYVEGGDLSQRLRVRPFTPREAAMLVQKVALALSYAHGEGVLHRDLKPSNILLDGDEPRLADFGLAAPLESGGDLTLVTGILGTPHYLAPEAFREGSAALSVASDLYALGTILFELLTGRTPFAGASPAALAVLLEGTEAPSPRLLAPAVPLDLETICLRCLEREPSRRYSGADSLAEDLRRFLAGEPILARPVSGPERFVRWCRRRPALAAVWLLVAALATGSTVAAVVIQRMLVRARTAEAASRERLREARLAEAGAVRGTTEPGRRARAIAALTEAAGIRVGLDVRNEMINALILPDLQLSGTWDIPAEQPMVVSVDARGRHALAEFVDFSGNSTNTGRLHRLEPGGASTRLPFSGTSSLGSFRFNADGTELAARYPDDTVRVWRAGEAEPYLVLRGRPNPGGDYRTAYFNDDFDFGPGGGFVVGLPGGGLSLHRLPDGAELARNPEGGRFSRVRIAPDGRHLVASIAADPKSRFLSILEVPSLSLLRRIELGSEPSAVAWSLDGDRIAVALANNTVEIHSVSEGALIQAFPSPIRSPAEIGFVADERFLALRGGPATLFLMNPLNGREVLQIPDIGVAPLSSGPAEGRLMTTTLGGRVLRWAVVPATGYLHIPPPRPGGREQSYANACLDFSPDGRWEVSSHGRFTVLREVASGRLLCEFDDHDGHGIEFATVAFAADGRSLVRSSAFTGLARHPLQVHADGRVEIGPGQVLDPSPGFQMTDRSADRRRAVLVGAESGRVKVLELAGTGEVKQVGGWVVPGVYAAAFSPDADRVLINCVGGGELKMRVCRVTDGATLAEPEGEAFGEVTWSADGTVAMTTNGQQESRTFDTATWKLRSRITGDAGGNITSFQLSPDGSYAVSVRNGTVHLIRTRDAVEFAAFQPPNCPGMASAVRFLPDGRRFGILWRDSQLDIVDPEAIRSQLETYGLAWPMVEK